MKKTSTFLRGLIALYALFFSSMICQAQLYSNTTNWTVYNSTSAPTGNWSANCPGPDPNWVTPIVKTPVGTQPATITAVIGASAQPIWGGVTNYAQSSTYFRANFYWGVREGCTTDSLVIMGDDQIDEIWINGHYLGSTPNGWANVGRFLIPASFLVCGCNTIGVKASDTQSQTWWMACKLFQNPGDFYPTCAPTIAVSGHCQHLCFSMSGSCSPCQEVTAWNLFGSCPATDLGDGCYDFSCPGPITVEMYTYDECTGRTDRIVQDFIVDSCEGCQAYAGFTFSGTNPITFTDASTGSGTVSSWYWDFGDGTNSTAQNPTHLFVPGGTYNVCLTVIVQNPDGSTCCDQFCKVIQAEEVHDTCEVVANFTWTSTTLNPYALYFTNMSYGWQSLCAINWFFGDPASGTINNQSTLSNPVHFFTHGGMFHVCLYVKYCVYDINGQQIDKCDQTICYDIMVGDPQRQGRPLKNDNEGILQQNIPNPFTGQTEIGYRLPENFKSAVFIVTNEQGVIVLQRNVEIVAGIINVDASKFASGTYNYQMIVDGNIMETKRMLLTK